MVAPESGSAKEIVELVVRANPDPDDGVAASLAHGPVLLVDADGPDMVVAAERLEPERGVSGVLGEDAVGTPGGFAGARVERPVGPPEAGAGEGFHSRLVSKGTSPSVADSRRKASRRGRAAG